jgi:uncharacterized membrane protein YdjX (TVP38/TMEM64 family)
MNTNQTSRHTEFSSNPSAAVPPPRSLAAFLCKGNVMRFMIWFVVAQAISTVAVCALGAFSMWFSGGETGIGWAILGVVLIWACDVSCGSAKHKQEQERTDGED